MRFANFVSGTYQSWSPNASCERSINLYPEAIESPGGKSRAALYGTPGLAVWTTLLTGLPTSPVRGLWAGENRLFAVSGSHYYELFDGGTWTDRGDVGDDGNHTPVSIWPNGTQNMIISAGKVWIDTGVSLVQPFYSSSYGNVNTTPPNLVHRVYGDSFTESLVGSLIWINNVSYTVLAFVDPDNITLTTGAVPLQFGVPYAIPVGGDVDANHTELFYHAGDQFFSGMVGQPINVGGTTYTVTAFANPTHITISGDVGVGPTHWWVLPPVLATSGCFLDGYFIIAEPNSKNFHFSELNDGTRWDPLEVSVKEGYPDNIAALYADHEELWIFGTHWSTEVWRNEGDPDLAGGFRRDPGAFIHVACVAPWSIASVAQGLHFLGGDTRGRIVAYRAQGFQPVRVSTHAVEQIWSTYDTVWDAYAYAYEEEGHEFWVLAFQSANATWVYDATTQQWHERAFWNGTSFERHKGRCHAFPVLSADGKGRHLVGAWDSGIIYEQSHAFYTDAGTAIHRVRQAPHASNEELNIFHHRLQLDLEVNGTAPSVALDWSDDDGVTFVTPKTRAPSIAGNRGRVMWNRLGCSRDRVYRVTITDAVKVAIVDAYLNPQPTMGYS